MDEEKVDFVKNLGKENDSLVKCLRKLQSGEIRSLQPLEILKIKSSFEKLVQIIQGLPPCSEWLSLEFILSYNYCYTLLLILKATRTRQAASINSESGKDSVNQGSTDFVRIFDNFLERFLLRVDRLRANKLTIGRSTCDANFSLSQQIVDLLLSVWIPGSVKVSLLRLAALYCVWQNERGLVQATAETCDQLLQFVLPKSASLFKIESIDPVLGIPRVSSEEFQPQAISMITDAVRILRSFSSFRLSRSKDSLIQLQEIETHPLKMYSLYVEGYMLFRENLFAEAFDLMTDLARRDDLSRELSLMVRNLIGCCLSAQGRPRSAIQVFKKCLKDDLNFRTALYNIALQYRKLLLFDAELEMLQLLVKLIASEEDQNAVCDGVPSIFLDPTGRNPSIDQNSIALSRPSVMYIRIRRLVDLQRFDEALPAYQELISFLSSIESRSIVIGENGTGDRIPSLRSLYRQAVRTSINARKFDQTVLFCDTLIRKSFSRDFHDETETLISQTITGSTLNPDRKISETWKSQTKRSREVEDEMTKAGAGGSDVGLFNAEVLLCKSEALFNLGRRNESLLFVNKAIEVIESIWKQCTSPLDGDSPPSKRLKTDVLINANVRLETSEEGVLYQMTSSAYSIKSFVLITLGRLQDALHWSRLAYQLSSGDTNKVYNLALLLYKLGRGYEAASLWLSHRTLLPALNDTLQSDVLIKQCLATVKELPPTDSDDTKRRWSLLDIEALRTKKSAKY